MPSILWNDPLLAKFNFQPSQEAQITAIIQAVDFAIDRETKRNILYNQWDRCFTMLGTGEIHLSSWPVEAVLRVMDRQIFCVQIAGTATINNVSTTTSSVILTQISGGISTVTMLTYAAYPTLNALVEAINNVATFSATLGQSIDGDLPSSDLKAGQSVAITTQTPTGALAVWTGAPGSFGLATPDLPILNLFYGTQFGDRFAAGFNGYEPSPARMHAGNQSEVWPYQKIRVVWTGGYGNDGPCPYPEDLASVVAQMTGYMATDRTGVITSENFGVGKYQYSVGQVQLDKLPLTYRKILNSYKFRKV